MFNKLLTNNSALYKCIRTIIQGVIGAIIANLDAIIAHVDFFPMWSRAIITALVMAILSPIMATMGDDHDLRDKDLEE